MKIKLFSIFTLSFLVASTSSAEGPLRVVTTLSTFASIASEVGGERIDVVALAPARFNPHFFEPRPTDVAKVRNAELFIHAGMDLELWRGPLVDAAGNRDVRSGGARELDLSQFVEILGVPKGTPTRAEGDIHIYGNPHYWLAPKNGMAIAQGIAEKLSAIDPSHADEYRKRLASFSERLQAAIQKWKAESIKLAGAEYFAYHDDVKYLVEFLGIKTPRFLEPKPGIPPSGQHLAELITYLKANQVRGILQASFYPKDAGEYLEEHAGIKAAIVCQNVRELPECVDYISLIDTNVKSVVTLGAQRE